MSIGKHHSAKPGTTTWLTPPEILEAVGGWSSFALDPCAAPNMPWRTAQAMNTAADADGLSLRWGGRVWLNPPYTAAEIALWMQKMAEHAHGTALIFARTETESFHRNVWERASGLLFLEGRLHFHDEDGTRAKFNGGAPSVLVAYGQEDLDRLAAAPLAGALVPLRFARIVAVAGMDMSWAQAMKVWLQRQHGTVSVSDAYRFFATHPKAARNPSWKAKVRQKLQLVGRRVGHNQYEVAA